MPVTFRYDLPEVFKIARMKHRVVLCSMDDVVTKDGEMILSREGIREVWASIDDRRDTLQDVSGFTLDKNKERQSQLITTRYMYDLNIQSTAWIFERRRKSAPRWFKVLGAIEHRLVFIFSTRLVERSDIVTPPTTKEQKMLLGVQQPDSVKL